MYVHHTGGSALVYVNEGLRIAKPSLAQSRSQSGADSVNRGAVFRPIFYSWNYTLLLPRKSAGQGPCSSQRVSNLDQMALIRDNLAQ